MYRYFPNREPDQIIITKNLNHVFSIFLNPDPKLWCSEAAILRSGTVLNYLRPRFAWRSKGRGGARRIGERSGLGGVRGKGGEQDRYARQRKMRGRITLEKREDAVRKCEREVRRPRQKMRIYNVLEARK